MEKRNKKRAITRTVLSLTMAACMAVSGTGMPISAAAAKTGKQRSVGSAGEVTWVMSQENNYFQDKGTVQTEDWNESDHKALYIDVDETITYQQMAKNVWGGASMNGDGISSRS